VPFAFNKQLLLLQSCFFADARLTVSQQFTPGAYVALSTQSSRDRSVPRQGGSRPRRAGLTGRMLDV
jgi:hypothetical protein